MSQRGRASREPAAALRRSEPNCAICWIDPETGQRGTNETTKLCRKCRTDPANADWVEEAAIEDVPRRRAIVGSIDASIREAVRDVVREEVRLVIRDEIAKLRGAMVGATKADAGDYLSVAEAATLIRVHPATIRGWIREGQLPQHRAGRHYRVKRSELQAFAASLSKTTVDLDALATKLSAA